MKVDNGIAKKIDGFTAKQQFKHIKFSKWWDIPGELEGSQTKLDHHCQHFYLHVSYLQGTGE